MRFLIIFLPLFLFAEFMEFDLYKLISLAVDSNKINILLDDKIEFPDKNIPHFKFYFSDKIDKKVSLNALRELLELQNFELVKKSTFYLIKNKPKNESKSKVDETIELIDLAYFDENINALASDYNISIKSLNNRYLLKGSKLSIDNFKNILKDINLPREILVTGEIIELKDDLLHDIGVDVALFSNFVNQGSGIGFSFLSAINSNSLIKDILPKGFDNFDFISVIRFLKEEGFAVNLTSPNFRIVEGEESYYHFGDTDSIVKSNVSRFDEQTPLASSTYDKLETGLLIKANAKIFQNDFIKLDLDFDFSSLNSVDGGYYKTSNRKYKGSSILKNGETFLLAGLSKEVTEVKSFKLPFISNIPIAGKIFEHSYNSSSKNSLFIYFKVQIKKFNGS